MTKTRQQEWEEAVELDKILEDERRQQSSKKLQQANDYQYQQYMDKVLNPGNRNYSSGISGILGGGGTGSQYNASFPDLLQSKRESKQMYLICQNLNRNWEAKVLIPLLKLKKREDFELYNNLIMEK